MSTPIDDFTDRVQPHLGCMHHVARSVLHSDDLAWDAVQETLMRLWRGGSLPAEPRRVLLALVFPMSLHVRRTLQRRGRHELNSGKQPPACEDPFCVAERNELRVRLDEAMAALPDACRETLFLCEVEQLAYADIAARQGVPIGTVRSRINRAREILSGTLAAVGEPAA